MTWDADTFAELIMEPESISDLLARLAALPEADRTSTRRAFGKALPELRRRLRTPQTCERFSLLAATLNCSVTQTLATFTPWSMTLLARDEAAHDHVLTRFLARGRDWTDRFVTAVMIRRPIARVAAALVDPFVTAHELPLPTDAGYLEDWLKRCFLPRPGVRWTEQFLIACTAQNAFRFQTNFWDDEARAGNVRARVAQLRDLGEFDDATVSRALIQILERGDNRNAQRGALDWLVGLGLAPRLWEERARLIAALPSVQPNVLARVLDALIQPGTTPGELAEIAVAVLPRQEKQPRRDVLRALSRVGSPTPELLETVRFITSGQDSVAAGLALSLLDGWGESRPEVEVSGLWCNPSSPDLRRGTTRLRVAGAAADRPARGTGHSLEQRGAPVRPPAVPCVPGRPGVAGPAGVDRRKGKPGVAGPAGVAGVRRSGPVVRISAVAGGRRGVRAAASRLLGRGRRFADRCLERRPTAGQRPRRGLAHPVADPLENPAPPAG